MLLCNQTDPNADVFYLQPCFENQDINQITLCYRKAVTHLTGIWRAENISSMALPAFLMQLFVILSLNRLLTLALRRFHVPRIAAEILGGLILGPSGVGFVDVVTRYVLPWGTIQTLENVANLGLVYFMFIVGLEVDLQPVLRAGKKPLTTAVAGILLPFPIGYGLHHLLIKNFGLISQHKPNRFGPLFWGLALATTNFPDLAGLLADLKLLHTDVGRTSLTSAVVSDILCWFLFVFTLATSHNGRVFTMVTTSLYLAFCILALRPALRWAFRKTAGQDGTYDQRHVAFVMAGVILSAFITDACGSHSFVGAFVFGLVLPKGELKSLVVESVEEFVSELLIPLFFFTIGLRADLNWMFERGVGGGAILLVVVLAFVAKIFSTFVVAFFINGTSARDGVALGLLMNTKGLLSLIIINTGRDLFALDMQTFMVILLALWLMTAAVGPILSLTYKSKRPMGLFRYRTIRAVEDKSEFRVITCLHSTRSSGGLIALLRAANPSKHSPVLAFALHLVELVGHASAMLIVHDAIKSPDRAKAAADGGNAANTLEEALEGLQGECFSVQSLTAVSAYSTMHEDICSLGEDKHATLILLPFHVSTTTAEGGAGAAPESSSTAESPFRAVNRNVLDNARCSVAIFVDRGFNAAANNSDDEEEDRSSRRGHGFRHQFAVLFMGGRDDREALAYAWRMAKSPRVALTVTRFIPSKAAMENNPNLLRGFAESDSEGEEDKDPGERAMAALAESEREKPLDDQYIEEFRLKTRDDPSMKLIEVTAENGEDVVRMVSKAEARYDLYVVGRGKGGLSPLTSGLSGWSEYPELGPLGDILVCSTFAAESSVLVVQQGVAGETEGHVAVGRVREQFGHMTWHPPEMNNSAYAPFIHRRSRVGDEDDHL